MLEKQLKIEGVKMDSSLGHQLPRAKPVTLTFYDWLKDYPYTTTFYVRDEATTEQIQALITSVAELSQCILGKYKVGHEQYVIPDYLERLKSVSPYAMGTYKWLISYSTPSGMARSHSIPGLNREYSLSAKYGGGLKKRADMPYEDHPKWQAFLTIFKTICVTKEGETISPSGVQLSYTKSNWPPKGAKKRR
jgi:hypothetical protein